jgi:hypothetical protein
MKSELELLEAINKRQTPAEISTGISRIMTEGDDLGCLSTDNDLERNGLWALPWMGPAFPSMILQPMQRAEVHPLDSSRVYVSTDTMGAMYILADANHIKKEGAMRERPCQSRKVPQMKLC